MRIRQNTQDLFIAEQVPWLIAIMLFLFIMAFAAAGIFLLFQGEWVGLIFGGFGGGMGFAALCVFVERLQLRLNAQTDQITLRRRTILGFDEKVLRLSDLTEAVVETTTSRGENGTKTLSRPSLVLSDQGRNAVHPVTAVYSSGHGAQRLVDAVNDWLDQRANASGSRVQDL